MIQLNLPSLSSRFLMALLAGAVVTHASAYAADKPTQKVAAAQPAAPIQVMILGSYHMGNPGLDTVNIEADDVTLPKRQLELAVLAEQLARFAPTKVAVEMVPTLDSFVIAAYEKFTPADLLNDRNEIAQIGFRLAKRMKHRAVFAIDEQSKTIDYYPFDKVEAYANTNGQDAEIASLKTSWQALGAELEAMQKRSTVSQILRELNSVKAIASDQSQYTKMLRFGQGNDWVGADLNAAWYLRNAKIHAKLMKIAQPGDRIVVLYGAGHNYLLRDFVRTTPGFLLIEPRAYLR